MNPLFLKIIRFIDRFDTYIGKGVSWLTLLLVLIICYDVVTRYVFGTSSVALQELEWHLFALIFLLSAGYTLLTDDHVRVDVFYTRYSVKKKALIDLIGSLLFLLPFCMLVILSSEDFVINSYRVNEISPDAGGLPHRFIIKGIIPVSFILLFLQGISFSLKAFLKLTGIYPDAELKSDV